MENPFVFSDLVFDPDYMPEGLAQQFGYAFSDKQSLKFMLGEFVLDEIGASSRGKPKGYKVWGFSPGVHISASPFPCTKDFDRET